MFPVIVFCFVSAIVGSTASGRFGFRSDEWLLRNVIPEGKVVAGEDAADGEFPYQVSLRFAGLFKGHFCGGSILSENVVLTAGHCVKNSPPMAPFTYIEVAAGKYRIRTDGPHVQVSRIKTTVIHPKYPGGVNPYDIAVLILEKPFRFNKYVQAAALPQPGKEHSGNATVSGWGSVSDTTFPKAPVVLQKATLPLIEFEACMNEFENSTLDALSNICTGPVGGHVSPCSGDSGGPLSQNINGTSTIIGVVSWGMTPCGYGHPTVYTKVSSFIDFIESASK